jgi:TRAP-type C4-dicarboxylate transport system substrate-binding protein
MPKILVIVAAILMVSLLAGCSSSPSTALPPTSQAPAPPATSSAQAPPPASSTTTAPTSKPTSTAPPTTSAPAKVYKIDFIRFLATNDATYKAWKPLFIDKINERAKGELVITDRGGTEVVGQFDQATAVKNGMMQAGAIATGFSTSVIPAVDALRLSRLSPQAERAKAMSYLQELFNKSGLYYVGRQQPIKGYQYWLFLKKSVTKQSDFAGLKLGGSASFHAAYKGWGATPVNLAIQEYYPAVERGVVDGNSGGLNVYMSIAEYEVAPYVIDQPFYNSTVCVAFNLATWNSLPANLQKIILDTQLEIEDQWDKIAEDNVAGLRNAAIAKKAQFIKLAPDVNTWFLDSAYATGWEEDAKKYPPDVVNKMKELLSQ